MEMARTNSLITIYNRNKAWNGTQGTASYNSYNAWIEEHVNFNVISSVFGGSFEGIESAKGLGIIFEDVNLTNSYMIYNNNNYEILKYAKFMDYRGNVRHIEFIYG